MPLPLEKDVRQLSAKMTALIMLVEALYAGELAKDEDPALIGEEIVKGLLSTEEKVRHLGDEEYSLMISEAVSSLIDRAVSRAVRLRSKGTRKRPDR